jgi:hypothetical protein
MNFFIQIIIFLFIVFVYLHVRFQLKVNNDLEVYEIDFVNNENLQKVCDIRNPVLFDAPDVVVKHHADVLTKQQSSLEVQVYDIHDFYADKRDPPVSLSLSAARELVTNDTQSKYYSANNATFLEETELKDEYRKDDEYLKPALTCWTKYDYIFGGKNTITPFSFHVDYRRFLFVAKGQIQVKMSPWKYHKYVKPIYNFKEFEFYSKINVWEKQAEYENEYDKLKFVDVIVPAGRVLSIPPYWWYSIKFEEHGGGGSGSADNDGGGSDTVVCGFSYRTCMNVLAILPKITASYIPRGTPN